MREWGFVEGALYPVHFSFSLFYFSFQTHPMQSNRRIANIALIGFMGTGKTSVGRLVAEQLHFHYLDTDEMIQSATGKTVADIFSTSGEPAFRALEEKAVQELAEKNHTVISCGGGGARAIPHPPTLQT